MDKQLADGLICIQLEKNDWTEDKHLGGKTDATSAFRRATQTVLWGNTWNLRKSITQISLVLIEQDWTWIYFETRRWTERCHFLIFWTRTSTSNTSKRNQADQLHSLERAWTTCTGRKRRCIPPKQFPQDTDGETNKRQMDWLVCSWVRLDSG